MFPHPGFFPSGQSPYQGGEGECPTEGKDEGYRVSECAGGHSLSAEGTLCSTRGEAGPGGSRVAESGQLFPFQWTLDETRIPDHAPCDSSWWCIRRRLARNGRPVQPQGKAQPSQVKRPAQPGRTRQARRPPLCTLAPHRVQDRQTGSMSHPRRDAFVDEPSIAEPVQPKLGRQRPRFTSRDHLRRGPA